jgi:hypothetical protein
MNEGVATEGHPYKNATGITVMICRGGPPWPPHRFVQSPTS